MSSILSRYPALAASVTLVPTCTRPSRMDASKGPYCVECGDATTGQGACDLCQYERQVAVNRAPDLFTLGVELSRLHALRR